MMRPFSESPTPVKLFLLGLGLLPWVVLFPQNPWLSLVMASLLVFAACLRWTPRR
jgi:hypothetical protein